jgi:hypothetical protein
LEIFDETLDINSTENYDLLIQASQEEFSFAIHDTLRNKFILLRSWEPENVTRFTSSELTNIISSDDFLGKRFHSCSIVLPSGRSTIVPAPLYDPAHKADYFGFNLPITGEEEIFVNKVADPDAYLLFAVGRPVSEAVLKYYPTVHPSHQLKPLLYNAAHNSKQGAGSYYHLHAERDYFNLLMFENGSLKFCNTFTFRNVSDILYYTLNLLKQHSAGNDTTIHLSGILDRYDDLWSAFSMYVKNLVFVQPSGAYTFSYVFGEVQLHRYLNLFTSLNCE